MEPDTYRLWLDVKCISINPADKNMGDCRILLWNSHTAYMQGFLPWCVSHTVLKCPLKVTQVTNTKAKSIELYSIHVTFVSIQSLCLYIISFSFTHRTFLHCIETQQAVYEQTLPNFLCLIRPLSSTESMFCMSYRSIIFWKDSALLLNLSLFNWEK